MTPTQTYRDALERLAHLVIAGNACDDRLSSLARSKAITAARESLDFIRADRERGKVLTGPWKPRPNPTQPGAAA